MRTSILTVVVLFLSASDGFAQCHDLSGRWGGCWVSDKSGHKGPLNAKFEKVGEHCYRVRFTGRFWGVLPFVYSQTLRVTGVDGDTVFLAGETALGPVLGTYRYDAVATPTHFEAAYTSKRDRGRFVMDRK